MDIVGLLDNKTLKSLDKRAELIEAIRMEAITIHEIQFLKAVLDDKKMAVILEAIEAISLKNPGIADSDWLKFAQEYITSKSNSLKREASRIVGNIAHLFPDDLEVAIQKLLENTNNDGTVIRWSSAYALGRIISIPEYASSDLFDVISGLYELETDNGVKNQYLYGIKKALKTRVLLIK